MNLSAALLHSILRTLNSPWITLAPEIKKEISESLIVEKHKNSFEIIWKRNGSELKSSYPSSSFTFYEHKIKEKNNQQNITNFSNKNIDIIEKIIQDLTGNPEWKGIDTTFPRKNSFYPWQYITTWNSVIVLAFAANGYSSIKVLLILLLLLNLEIFFFNYLWIGITPLYFSSLMKLPFTGIFGSIGIFFISCLSPNKIGRIRNICTSLATFTLNYLFSTQYSLSSNTFLHSHWWLFLIFLTLMLFSLFKDSHALLIPIAFPWFAIGLILDGATTVGIILGFSILIRTLFQNATSNTPI